MNPVDSLIAYLSPTWGLRREQARRVLAYYEAAKPSTQRKFSRDKRGPNLLADQSATALRDQVRYAERNHDLVAGTIDTLVNNIVGPQGLGVEFQPRRTDGTIHTEYANALRLAWEAHCRRPEVTRKHTDAAMQRLVCRTWVRDGEAFAQQLIGPVAGLQHSTAVPYSLELLEPDLLPHEYNDAAKNIRQSVQINAWGQATAYWVLKQHPGEGVVMHGSNLKAIPAGLMLHLAELTRIGQLRGITRFASVINRIADIKDYEESERIAAKIAAMLTAYVKRQAPADEGYTAQVDASGNPVQRQISLAPGAIIDTLAIGEEIGLIDTSRPNVNLVHFRNGQLRAFAAGVRASYSSISRNYDGTYSAQRQEMVEQWVHYAAATDEFVGQWYAPYVQGFITAAHLSGAVRRPSDVVTVTADDVLYIAPSMPWIDPAKEALADLTLVRAGFTSEVEVMRRRGRNPDTVLQQVSEWRRKVREAGIVFDSDAALLHATQAAAINDGSPGTAGGAASSTSTQPGNTQGTAP